ncbi:MAG: sigma 54-interacting transcriptional regulator [Candidatus Zixiibacteriota bacterium]|nr:MAG: sigma 54-interacting transcriptional regulator [candidate division Zixibacteria bacterium]
MSLTSRQNTDFDSRLKEIDQLYRQRKPDIAREQLQALAASGYKPVDYELGLYKALQAADFYFSGKYQEAIETGLEASKLLASSALHRWVGNLYLTLYRSYLSSGDLKSAERYAVDALAFYRRVKDDSGMAGCLNGMARLAYIRCDYAKAKEYINEAIQLSKGDNIRMVEETGNLGRIEIRTGDWQSAEEHLKSTLKLANELGLRLSLARNHLSLGLLSLRLRNFTACTRELRSASVIIEEDNLLRERAIYLEYAGELALEQGDIVQAKKLLGKGYELGRELAVESDLTCQITRRMAQVELQLDNLDEALRLAQKSLDIANKLGEKNEIGLSHIVIAEIFAARDKFDASIDYVQKGMEVLTSIGDPHDIARSLMILGDIYSRCKNVGHGKFDKAFDEAFRIFNKLRLYYWSAEARFRQGVYCCQHARISVGFKSLLEAERIFDKVSEKAKVRSIRLFKQELSKQAVAISVSAENEFKIFGDYFTDKEYSNLKSGPIQEFVKILGGKTDAHRVIIYSVGQGQHETVSSEDMTPLQRRKFLQQFEELLGEEFNSDKPTLILDSRRDPFINDLLSSSNGDVISSVIVVPLVLGKEITGYVYLDRITTNGNFKPFGQKELNFAVGFADLISLKMTEYDKFLLEEDNKRLKAQLLEKSAFPNIITQSKQMLEMLARVQQVVNSNISISIEGETGSGKDLLAKTIHYNSSRKDKRFISVNCAALPETLLESELFGHKRGAFTGADRDKVGLFEEADGGTFFLDEIADMPLSIQAKVLRILEEKEIVRLGETKPIKVDVRIISATNKDLKVEMGAGRFRQDLYYRLTALCFSIPPLRERREDIPLLIRHFAGGKIGFTREAMSRLVSFDWPGNVRELENEVKKLVLLAGDKSLLDVDLLSAKIIEHGQEGDSGKPEINTDITLHSDFSLYDYLAEYEKRFIIKALREQSGVKKHAAAFLNIPESTLRLKIKQYNIDLKDLPAVS